MSPAIELLVQVRDGLRRLDPAWCELNDQQQISDEELDCLIGEVEDFMADARPE
jgi:hypothetical protein